MNRKATTAIPYTEMEVADGNFDTSRSPIDRVIIHTMDGTAEGAAARFDNPTSQVSAHYGVRLDGSLIHWLEEYYTAYHAGDYPMNQRSIGIEHEDNGDYNGVRPDALYTTSAKLVRDICLFYNIPIDRDHIKKHNEVSDAPTGCPDALDIDRIVREAATTPQDQQALISQLTGERDDNGNIAKAATDTLKLPVPDNPTHDDKVEIANNVKTSIEALYTARNSYRQALQVFKDAGYASVEDITNAIEVAKTPQPVATDSTTTVTPPEQPKDQESPSNQANQTVSQSSQLNLKEILKAFFNLFVSLWKKENQL